MKDKTLKIILDDPWLEPVSEVILRWHNHYKSQLERIENDFGSLAQFADWHHYLGIHFDEKAGGWYYREYAPQAKDMFFFGDFNRWHRTDCRMERKEYGVWEIFLSSEQYGDSFVHGSKVKVLVHGDNGWYERIPVFSSRVVQDDATKDFCAQLWFSDAFSWDTDKLQSRKMKDLFIYECH
ncbi:MAG: 1,4-alpha-glucan-branching enzyme, partial [Bacteroidales bacterium]|nr:1,4-alpha-glucan-branching enzyme [Bacteroidales bacterium]